MVGRILRTFALASSALALTAPHAGAAVIGTCVPDSSWPAADAALSAQVIELVNAHRATRGLGALSRSTPLTAAAEWKSRHMAAYGYFSHADVGYPAPGATRSTGDRIETCGYTAGGWGENIAAGYPSPAAVMEGWLGSPGHRANIENGSFAAIGVGVARRADGTIEWTQVFGSVADSGAPPVVPPPSPGPAPPTAPPAGPGDPPAAPPEQPEPAVTALVVTGFTARAARARAGRLFRAHLFVRRTSPTGPLLPLCEASVGSRPSSVRRARLVERRGILVARCVWRVPAGTAGERLSGRIGIGTDDAAVHVRFAAQVRA